MVEPSVLDKNDHDNISVNLIKKDVGNLLKDHPDDRIVRGGTLNAKNNI